MKKNYWFMFGVSAFISAVLIMAVILIVSMVTGMQKPVPVVNTPPADVYDFGSRNQFIVIDSLKPTDKISSPFELKGKARLWYFEGSFPIELKDANGNTLAVGFAQANGDWMTESMVPFTAVLNFPKPQTATGTLILKKDNPSGLPEYDDQVSLAVNFTL